MHTKEQAHKLFDELISTNGLHSDSDLARKMGVGRDAISRVRNGAQLTDPMRLAILRNFRMSIRRLDSAVPPKHAKWSPK